MPHKRVETLVNLASRHHLPVILIAVLATAFWWESLVLGKIIIHADAAHHGLSLLTFLSQFLSGEREISWDSGIYGGHPLFAESQGGFLNPINLFSAYFFDPKYGIGIQHWLSMLLSGLGTYKLCKVLNLTSWPASFAGLAVIFSGIWIGFQYNLSVSGTLAWVPWLFCAVEHWLKRPTYGRSVYIAIAAALIIFAGYPHLAHGAAIYIACRLSVYLFHKNGLQDLQSRHKKIIKYGLLAIFMAIGLSAVQLLPLIELISKSHRESGIKLEFGGLLHAKNYLQGLFYFYQSPQPSIFVVNNLSSLCVAFFAGCIIFTQPRPEIIGHTLGAFVLYNLGMEFSSPLFRAIYENHLIPGLHSYRIMHPFFPLAIIGISVASAYSLDTLSRFECRNRNWKLYASAGLYISAFITACLYLYAPEISGTNLIFFAALALGAATVIALKSLSTIPYIALLAICAEICATKIGVFNFYDTSILEKPEAIEVILSDRDIKNYKATIDTISPAMVFLSANDPRVGPAYTRYLKSISPFPGLLWGIPSINGVLGLELKGRALIQKTIENELNGVSTTPPGNRIIDTLGVKYISRDSQTPAPGFEIIHQDTSDSLIIYRNNYAKPKLRLYPAASNSSSAEEALIKLIDTTTDALFITPEGSANPPSASNCSACLEKACGQKTLSIIHSTSTLYKITVSTACGAWLFIADANYPGWNARVNGKPSTVYTAQVLGKAVYVPKGVSTVVLEFKPFSLYAGATISAITALLILLITTIKLRKKP